MLTDVSGVIVALAAILQIFSTKKIFPSYQRNIGNSKFLYKKLEIYYNRLVLLNGISYFASALLFLSITYIYQNKIIQGVIGAKEYTIVYLVLILIYTLYPLFFLLFLKLYQSRGISGILLYLPIWTTRVVLFVKKRKIRNEEIVYIIIILKKMALVIAICVAYLWFSRKYQIAEPLGSFVVFAAIVSVGLIIFSFMFSIDMLGLPLKARFLRSITITMKNGTTIEVDNIEFEGAFVIYNETDKLNS